MTLKFRTGLVEVGSVDTASTVDRLLKAQGKKEGNSSLVPSTKFRELTLV